MAKAWQDTAQEGADNATQTTLWRSLRTATKKARRKWADKAVAKGNVRNVAKWRHGRKLSTVSALHTPDDTLTFEPTDMADILARRCFTQDPGDIAIIQPDDPPQRAARSFEPFAKRELFDLVHDTSSSSAPGHSGLSWAILQLAWDDIEDHIRAHGVGPVEVAVV